MVPQKLRSDQRCPEASLPERMPPQGRAAEPPAKSHHPAALNPTAPPGRSASPGAPAAAGSLLDDAAQRLPQAFQQRLEEGRLKDLLTGEGRTGPRGEPSGLPAQRLSRTGQLGPDALGPLRLVESDSNLHLASMDPLTRATVQAALQNSSKAPVSAPVGSSPATITTLNCGPEALSSIRSEWVQAPMHPPSGHLMTLPENAKKSLAAALQKPNHDLTAADLLATIGLSGTAAPPQPSAQPFAW